MKGLINKIYNEITEGKLFYLLLTIVIVVSTILNWNANLMGGILPYYLYFSDYFKNGFIFNQDYDYNIYTWPMWGYGLVLLLRFKLVIIATQQLLTFLVIILVRLYFRPRVDKNIFLLLSSIILCAFPWFFFQVSLWPYGISANLLTISLLLVSKGVEESKINYIIISAICFGIMLNLRSDYFYFSIVLSFVILLYSLIKKDLKRGLIIVLSWIFIVLITLLPWAIHSYKYSNKFSFVSSNSGHVFYISLGQLPNNKWNINPSDEDSTMRKYIDAKISIKESSLTSRSNEILMARFFELIKIDPQEYFKKCIYNLKSFVINPFYLGSVFPSQKKIDHVKPEIKKEISAGKYLNALKLFYNKVGFYVVFPVLSYLISHLLLITVFFSIYKYFKKLSKVNEIKILNLLILLVFSYQIALSVFAYHLPIYTTNIFLLLIILIGANFSTTNALN